MNNLVFLQRNDEHGSCTVFFNGVWLDQCDMNFRKRYTQAHQCIARAMYTFGENIEISIEGESVVGVYPIETLKFMALHLLKNKSSFIMRKYIVI